MQRLRAGPLFYFGFMLVSIPLTFNTYSVGDVREYISAALSGPLALVAAVIFFSHTKVNISELQSYFRATMLPILSISIFIATNLIQLQFITFLNASNFSASGGFGPNQVSAILGLGCLFCWLIILTADIGIVERLLFLGLGALWLAQCLLTFSRGGVANILVAAILAVPVLSANKGRMVRLFIFGLLFAAVVGWSVFPLLNRYTGGMLETRLMDFGTSNRDMLMQADLALWQDNLVFGVGPGASNIQRAPYFSGRMSAPHTEFTRMLAEHGLFGLASMLLMTALAIGSIFRAKDRVARGLAIAFLAWAFVEMTHSAMRISATPFLYGLAFSVSNHLATHRDEAASSLKES